MSVSHNSKLRALNAANDNSPGKPVVSMNFLDNPPVCTAEIEIFDRLISNLAELAANDDEMPIAGD
ncbi:hypothetical protein ABFZ85_06610 [Hyphococcus formosus]|uniref:hypothetical protein n=1 Tax=Hyphococcus formosus TaxID=3143534 RepID=UPI00398AF02E